MNPEGIANRTPVKPDLGIRARIELFKALHGFGEQNEQPLKSRIATAVKFAPGFLGLLATACGDTAVPPTSSTEIVSTTTTPTTEPPTSTTEAPTTTTSTTVPEPTTTTDPLEVCRASGDIYNGDTRLTKLGMVDVWESERTTNAFDYYVMLAKPVTLNTRIIDYQGTQKEIYTLSLCLGQYEDNTPYIREFMLDMPREDNGFVFIKHWTRNFNAASPTDDYLTFLDENTVALINQMIEEQREIGLYIPYRISSDVIQHDNKYSDRFKEVIEKIPYNNNTYNDLLNKTPNGIVKEPHEGEPEIGSVHYIYIFPPVGGW